MLTAFVWISGIFIVLCFGFAGVVKLLTWGQPTEQEMWAQEHSVAVADRPNLLQRMALSRKHRHPISLRRRRVS
jgi:hypothetical protein